MLPYDTSKNPDQKEEALASMMRDLRGDILTWTVWLLLLSAIILTASAASYKDSVTGIFLSLLVYALAGLVALLKGNHSTVAAWVLVVGVSFVFLLLAGSGHSNAFFLFGVPAGLAMLTIHPLAGLTIAVASSLLLWIPTGPFSVPQPDLTWALVNIWATSGLVWIAVNPLKNALEMAYSGYREGRMQLEQARDTQMELNQTLDDLKEANSQLTRLNRLVHNLYHAAEESRRVKEQFVANVSHELRTPLNMIIGFSEMILKSPGAYGRKVPPALLADLSVIVRNSQHLSELIDDVLDLSQIEAGQMAITREDVDLGELIEAAVVAVRPLYESKHLSISSQYPSGVRLFCDRTRIREVLINLLSNAGRFTSEGGVEISAMEDSGHATISVEDTGPGLSTEDQKQLFQPFHQVDSSIRRRYGGTGLGLSISKSLVELHGGRMWVESEKGFGAKFFFSLPVESQLEGDHRVGRWVNPFIQAEPRTHSSHAPVPVLHPRFVVVEEGTTLQRLLGRYIDQVEIDLTHSIEEAKRRLIDSPAQALLVNSSEPLNVIKELEDELFASCGVPAIVCSIPQLAEYTSSLGVAGYLVKPITREILLNKVESFSPPVKSVLIVDDEPDAIQIFRRMLVSSEKGYRILTATDGAQALALMRAENPDLVLLDLSMPIMDGFELLKARSEIAQLRSIPVLITSARDPLDQPISSPYLAVTRGTGMAAGDLLKCVESLSQILGPQAQPGHPIHAGVSPD